ncbi:hypothetical protein C8A00DRAFT_30297 [Chaetomidium leptoderma]|uniref:Nuclear segregation protein n=1 Tax=Chaetomidium leptoderma TaxID=669021 RepID=A0AAN6VT53_9PEZI|nr:hypothetical protein C8A00DRAFT_30297 [Chaetomidium leptoderma]
MATDSNSPTAAAAPAVPATKPSKPDEAVFKTEVARLEKENKVALDDYKAVKAKVDSAVPNKDTQSPTQKRRQELIAQANEIRKKQGLIKTTRTTKIEQIKKYDEQLRSRIAEQKTSRSKVAYKSVEEIDQKIAQLEREVETGKMKLVDEKKALTDVSALRKLRKNFSAFDEDQSAIDDIKAKIKEIKATLDDPEVKGLSEQYNKVQAELDTIKGEQDSVYKNLSGLRKQRDELRNKQQATWEALKKYKDEYHTQRKAALSWEREQREKRREREQADRERINKERKMARAQQMLEEASDPAYTEELRRATTLARFLDPSRVAEEKTPLLADKGLAAAPQRTVDASGFAGMKLVSKKDEAEDYLPAAKKGKKGKKSNASAPAASTKFSLPPAVMEDCTFVGIDPPMSTAEMPEALEKVLAKIAKWKVDGPEQTRKNIEKAKKEIERLEAEEAAANEGSGASTPAKSVNNEAEADKTVAEATEKVAEASLNEKETKVTEAVEA